MWDEATSGLNATLGALPDAHQAARLENLVVLAEGTRDSEPDKPQKQCQGRFLAPDSVLPALPATTGSGRSGRGSGRPR